METYLKLLVLLTVCYTCNGHLERLTGFLTGAHHQIHNKVHEVAGAVLGGFNFNVAGHVSHNRPPVHQQPSNGQTETIVVIVEEGGTGNQGQTQPPTSYGPPQQNYHRPPNYGHNPNQGYYPNQGYNPNQGHQTNRPVNPGQNSQRPYGQNNVNNYGNQHPNQNQNVHNSYSPEQIEQQPNQGSQGNQNQNGYGNNVYNGNTIPNQNGYGIPNNNVNNNKPNQNNEVKNPEQGIPNFNDNYKPTETKYGQNHDDAHNAENFHKEISDKTTKKPKDDGPLFVPLNDYNYGGDKITVNAPKRETDSTKVEEDEDEFAIDIRVKEE